MRNHGKLVFYGIITAFLYIALLSIPRIFHATGTPTLDIKPVGYKLLASFAIIAVYLLAYRFIKNLTYSGRLVKIVVAFALLFSVLSAVFPAIGSADVFNYIFRARVLTVYHQNPYITPTENFPADVLYNYSATEWNYLPMQYGPLWTAVTVGFSYLAKDNIFWNQFLYKLFAIALNAGMIFFILRIIAKINPNYRLKGLLLYAWNPLILFEAVNNAHNDFLMVFLALAAIYYFLEKKYIFSLILLFLSVLVKYATIVLLPVFIILIIKYCADKNEKKKIFIKSGLAIALIAVIAYLPFWEGAQTFKGLLLQSKIATFINFSLLPTFIFGAFYSIGRSWHWSELLLTNLTKAVCLYAFALVYIIQSVKLFKTKEPANIIHYALIVLLAYIVLAVVFLQPWYFLWILPLAALIERKYIVHLIIFFTLLGFGTYAVFFVGFLFAIMFIAVFIWSAWKKKNYFKPFLSFP